MRRPTGPATAARLAAVFGRALAAAGLCPRTDRLALAVSGGADSVALAALAAQWSESADPPHHLPSYGGTTPPPLVGVAAAALTGATWHPPPRPAPPTTRPLAICIDHGLRPGSAADAARAAGLATALGCEASIIALDWGDAGPPRGGAVETAARARRAAALRSAARAAGAAALVTAHHADDNVETVLLRLVRASGVDGLGGVRGAAWWLDDQNARPLLLLRPLLPVPKAALLELCHRRRLAWLADPTNAAGDVTPRNALRLALGGAPAAAAVAGRAAGPVWRTCQPTPITTDVARVAAVAAAARAEGEAAAAALLSTAVRGATLDVAALAAAPPDVTSRALHALVTALTGRTPRGGGVAALAAALAPGELRGSATGGGCVLAPVAGSRGRVATVRVEA